MQQLAHLENNKTRGAQKKEIEEKRSSAAAREERRKSSFTAADFGPLVCMLFSLSSSFPSISVASVVLLSSLATASTEAPPGAAAAGAAEAEAGAAGRGGDAAGVVADAGVNDAAALLREDRGVSSFTSPQFRPLIATTPSEKRRGTEQRELRAGVERERLLHRSIQCERVSTLLRCAEWGGVEACSGCGVWLLRARGCSVPRASASLAPAFLVVDSHAGHLAGSAAVALFLLTGGIGRQIDSTVAALVHALHQPE